MSILTALTTLLLFSSSADAQIFAPNCSTTQWNWTFNSLNQNPCTVAAYLESVCSNGAVAVEPLPPGWVYEGPRDPTLYGDDLCLCNTVTYSLLSACGACQGNDWVTWSEYVFNCTKTLPPSTFPSPVPAGIRVPQWALLDVTLENAWNANKSLAAGDSPEIGPGSLIGSPSSVITRLTGTSLTPTNFPAATASSSSGPTFSLSVGSSSNAGVIAGGVVGGVTVIAIAALLFFYLRRRRTTAPTAVFVGGGASPPHNGARRQSLDHGIHASLSTPEIQAPVPPMRVYNPNDPATFPTQQGAPAVPRGYNGRPLV